MSDLLKPPKGFNHLNWTISIIEAGITDKKFTWKELVERLEPHLVKNGWGECEHCRFEEKGHDPDWKDDLD